MGEFERKAEEIRMQIEAATKTANETKAALEEMKKNAVSAEVVNEMKINIEKIDNSIVAMNEQFKGMGKSEMEVKSLEDAMREVLTSDEYKSALKDVQEKKRQSTGVFEIKIDPVSVVTSGLTGDVARTVTPVDISAPGLEPNKFLAAAGVRVVPQDKNRASWFDGAYFSNVGYVSELTALGNADGATLTEKYRELAKVGAKLPFSAETTTDMSYFINWAKNEGVKYTLAKVDELIFAGAGADSTKPKEIYGVKAKGATAFNATTAGLALSVYKANLADLIQAAATQVRIQGKGLYTPNLVFLHPTNVAKLRLLKNTQADYINILPNGGMLVYGIAIAETARIAATEMLLVDTSTIQLHQKGSLEMEVERVASTDSFVMYLRWRGQVIVPTDSIKGNIYVANITTAIASLDVATVTTTAAPTTTV